MYFIRLSGEDYFGKEFYLTSLNSYTKKVEYAKEFETLDGDVEYAKRYSTMPFVLEIVNHSGSILSVVSKKGVL